MLEAVFDYLGTTDKIYVEFGVEDGVECNTRYLRSPQAVSSVGIQTVFYQGGERLERSRVSADGRR